MMKPMDAFGVVIRSAGLIMVVASLWIGFSALLSAVLGGPDGGGGMVLFYALPMLIAGLYLLRGAALIVGFAYPHRFE